MFGIESSELMLLAAVALVVIGPKDLPRAMRFVGQWIGRARGMARHFRSGIDEIIRQAEMDEMQKKWAAENARIMAEHPMPPPEEADDAAYAYGDHPVMTPLPAPEPDGSIPHDGYLPDAQGQDAPAPGHDQMSLFEATKAEDRPPLILGRAPPMSDGEDDIDASRAPLIDHLIELRSRLIRSFIALGAAFAVCLYFARPILSVLVHPLVAAGQNKLVYTQLFDAFFVEVKVAFFAAMMIAFPVIANQLWQFVAPGLYKKEKKALLPFLVATPVLFLLGACLAYFVAIPMALHFLLSFQGNLGGVQQEALPAVGSYLSLVMQFMFGFGLAFLTPVLLMLLERAGIVTRQQLISFRRYAIVLNTAIAALLAPPDVGSMILLGVPLILLYELALAAMWFTEKRAKQADASTALVTRE